MTMHTPFHRLGSALDPEKGAQERIRRTIMERIREPEPVSLLRRVSAMLQPSPQQQAAVRLQILSNLLPIPVATRVSYRAPKWIAACVLVLIGLRAGPLLFLAPQGIAHSSVMILPTQGDVLLSLQGMWQPITEEVAITEGVSIRTSNGEATILLHDDGTIRLGSHTTVTLHDVTDRPAPGIGVPTLTLTSGEIWLQGLLPGHIRGIHVITPGGQVTVHRGSVSMVADAEGSTDLRVWDRTAMVQREAISVTLVAGEKMTFSTADAFPAVRNIDTDEYDEDWVMQNLDRDAVHQREIAQMQQERRAARAGILPTSALYPVKRVAEKVDVLMTFGADSRIQKQINHASTRLDEAAALIADDASRATEQLMEYKDLLQAVGAASGTLVARAMLQEELVSASAELAAAMPSDELYLLKRTVLETSAELSEGVINEQDVEAMLLVDSLNGMRLALREGDTPGLESAFAALQPSLDLLDLPEEDGGLADDVRKEILSLLSDTARSLQEDETIVTDVTTELSPFLPPVSPTVMPVPITPEEIDIELGSILTRIEIYNLPRSRYNQLQYEMGRIEGHPAEGSLLRRLYRALEPELAQYVLPAMETLRKQMDNGR